MWDEIPEDEGIKREGQLVNEVWKDMINRGARTHRFHNTYASAQEILTHQLQPQVQPNRPLLLVRELVDQGLRLRKTSAARIILVLGNNPKAKNGKSFRLKVNQADIEYILRKIKVIFLVFNSGRDDGPGSTSPVFPTRDLTPINLTFSDLPPPIRPRSSIEHRTQHEPRVMEENRLRQVPNASTTPYHYRIIVVYATDGFDRRVDLQTQNSNDADTLNLIQSVVSHLASLGGLSISLDQLREHILSLHGTYSNLDWRVTTLEENASTVPEQPSESGTVAPSRTLCASILNERCQDADGESDQPIALSRESSLRSLETEGSSSSNNSSTSSILIELMPVEPETSASLGPLVSSDGIPTHDDLELASITNWQNRISDELLAMRRTQETLRAESLVRAGRDEHLRWKVDVLATAVAEHHTIIHRPVQESMVFHVHGGNFNQVLSQQATIQNTHIDDIRYFTPTFMDISASDIVIMVMGPSGTGKTNFLSKAADINLRRGDRLHSDSHSFQLVDFHVDELNRRVILVDTPSLDSSYGALKAIADWLDNVYGNDAKLVGILYLQSIAAVRMEGGLSVMLKTSFRDICGSDSLENVGLVTTMWDQTPDHEANKRQEELRLFWSQSIHESSLVYRFNNTNESAWKIISQQLRSIVARQKVSPTPSISASQPFLRRLASPFKRKKEIGGRLLGTAELPADFRARADLFRRRSGYSTVSILLQPRSLCDQSCDDSSISIQIKSTFDDGQTFDETQTSMTSLRESLPFPDSPQTGSAKKTAEARRSRFYSHAPRNITELSLGGRDDGSYFPSERRSAEAAEPKYVRIAGNVINIYVSPGSLEGDARTSSSLSSSPGS
ncbi:unnamed protein product [Cyclocybe aegerita]|uniref:G domain-containing protein n=1 Tax=Cyclocybe aegerita TaxID=1973307 RepID=A0A8S0W8H4_CYCAE|nr:unnamed protein product [Cyclocybe aegerita]